MGAYTGMWMQAAANTASGALGIGVQRAGTNFDQRNQREQQRALMGIQMQGEREMMDYQQMKQLEMWEKTGYGGQVEQMKRAGINPALLYGMGSGGGQSIGGGVPSVTGGQAPYVNTTSEGMGIDLLKNSQIQLLDAQRKNIEADTANKTQDTGVKKETEYSQMLDNALKSYMMYYDEHGNIQPDQSLHTGVAGKQKIAELKKEEAEGKFKVDENKRQDIMNSSKMKEIAASISLMEKQGMTQNQIAENLKKEGKLLQAEIEWNELGMKRGDLGKFIMQLIKHIIHK